MGKTRKSQCQKELLWDFYRRCGGTVPQRERIGRIAEQLGLSVN